MSSFIFLERLYNKGLNRSEYFFVHELSQLKLIDANVIHPASVARLATQNVPWSLTTPI